MGSSSSSSAFFLLVLASCSSPASVHGWRSECRVDGLDVRIVFHNGRERLNAPGDTSPGSTECQVAFFDHNDLQDPDVDLQNKDVIFTDSLHHAPFAGRNGPLHFLENVSSFHSLADLDSVMQEKTELLSVLLPARPDTWDELSLSIYEQAQALIPQHVYIDDGSLDLHSAAMSAYRFVLIADDLSNQTVSLAFVRSMSFHSIAVFNGFVEIGAMVFNGVADFNTAPFDLPATLALVTKHNEHLGALWHYQRILQDQMRYRYNRPFEERLLSQACSLCRGLHLQQVLAPTEPPLAFIGIYSARGNFAKRQAVRETWGRVLREDYGLRYWFFLGEASAGTSQEEILARQELEEHGDMVFLKTMEGYRMNSKKGLLFLDWIAQHSEAKFLLKVDDDVYFRPAPLLQQLLRRPAAQYVWGFFDYISPVPREEGHNFYNTLEDFPFDVFPPYPRGVVRVLSMDLVRLLAEAYRQGRLRMIYGDDPCIGLHLRQLLFDPLDPLPSLTLDDFDNRVFAMEPSCHRSLWSRISNYTWAIHHVSPEQIRCMWEADLRAGYYSAKKTTPPPAGGAVKQSSSSSSSNGSGSSGGGGSADPWRWPLHALPDLCHCVPEADFLERSDLEGLRNETNRILFDEADS